MTLPAFLARLRTGTCCTNAEARVLVDVLTERTRQDAKWGEQNHDPALYLAILMEEVGEAAQAALQSRFGGKTLADYRAELVQVAAVAVAMIECLDRGAWRWGSAREEAPRG